MGLMDKFKGFSDPNKHRAEQLEKRLTAYWLAWNTIKSVVKSVDELPSKAEFEKLIKDLDENIIGEKNETGK
jgi:hypothetical protein